MLALFNDVDCNLKVNMTCANNSTKSFYLKQILTFHRVQVPMPAGTNVSNVSCNAILRFPDMDWKTRPISMDHRKSRFSYHQDWYQGIKGLRRV